MADPTYAQVVRRLIFAAGVTTATLAFEQAALAGMPVERDTVFGPVVLSDANLDALTARGITASLDLMATATGPSVVTSTIGSVRTARATILQISVEPGPDTSSGEMMRARLVGTAPADLLFAFGSATAHGQDNAQCAASLNSPSTFDYLTRMSVRSATPTLATCSCAAFGISLSP